jgi:AraC family transcriptional regulator
VSGEPSLVCGCPAAGHIVRTAGPFRIGRSRYAPRCTLGRHAHASARVVLTLDGAFDTRYGRQRLSAGTAAALFRPACEPHEDRYASEATCLTVVPDDLASFRAGVPFTLHDARFVRLAHDLDVELQQSDAVSSLALEALSSELLAVLTRIRPQERDARTWIRWVRDRLEDDCTRTPSLDELAGAVDREPSYLAAAFKSASGQTVGAFARERRLWRARALLASSDVALAEVAQRCGFADQSHLTRLFRRRFGVTPGTYRARFRT